MAFKCMQKGFLTFNPFYIIALLQLSSIFLKVERSALGKVTLSLWWMCWWIQSMANDCKIEVTSSGH